MPERETDKRRLALRQCQDQLDRWDKELNDQDWIERLECNTDWRKLCEAFREETRPIDNQLKELTDILLEKPMDSNETIKLKQAVMILREAVKNRENFLSFPAREKARLTQVRQEYPKVKNTLEQLKKEETTYGRA